MEGLFHTMISLLFLTFILALLELDFCTNWTCMNNSFLVLPQRTDIMFSNAKAPLVFHSVIRLPPRIASAGAGWCLHLWVCCNVSAAHEQNNHLRRNHIFELFLNVLYFLTTQLLRSGLFCPFVDDAIHAQLRADARKYRCKCAKMKSSLLDLLKVALSSQFPKLLPNNDIYSVVLCEVVQSVRASFLLKTLRSNTTGFWANLSVDTLMCSLRSCPNNL